MKTIKDIDEIEKDFIGEADLQKEAKKEKPKGAVGRGRPRKEDKNKANFQVYVNLTEDEKKAAEAKSEELGISLSALFKIGLRKVLTL